MTGALIPVFDFDITCVKALNGFLGTWPLFDRVIWVLGSNPLFKGLIFVAALWWLGMRGNDQQRTGFIFAMRWISGLFIALVLARFVQNYVPSHLRPISEASLDRKSTRLNSSHVSESRMPSSA